MHYNLLRLRRGQLAVLRLAAVGHDSCDRRGVLRDTASNGTVICLVLRRIQKETCQNPCLSDRSAVPEQQMMLAAPACST
jgi:hypothetical protein